MSPPSTSPSTLAAVRPGLSRRRSANTAAESVWRSVRHSSRPTPPPEARKTHPDPAQAPETDPDPKPERQFFEPLRDAIGPLGPAVRDPEVVRRAPFSRSCEDEVALGRQGRVVLPPAVDVVAEESQLLGRCIVTIGSPECGSSSRGGAKHDPIPDPRNRSAAGDRVAGRGAAPTWQRLPRSTRLRSPPELAFDGVAAGAPKDDQPIVENDEIQHIRAPAAGVDDRPGGLRREVAAPDRSPAVGRGDEVERSPVRLPTRDCVGP